MHDDDCRPAALCRDAAARWRVEAARVLSPAMIEFCARNHTGELRNIFFDATCGTRNWVTYPAAIGVASFVRGEGNLPGHHLQRDELAERLRRLRCRLDRIQHRPRRDLTLAFLSTGLMEDSHHLERIATLATLVLASMTE